MAENQTVQQTPTPSQKSSGVGLRKRQQIASSNKAMFIWVACASVLVAFALVVSIFLVKQILFTEKVLIEKGETTATLEDNIDVADDLDKAVKKLRVDKKLTEARSSASDSNLDVVIDALPYGQDGIALASSLETTLLTDITIEDLTPESSESEGSDSIDITAIEPVGDAQPMAFSFKVTGSSEQLETLFSRLNLSIRPIKLINLQLEAAGVDKLTATVEAVTFYQPKKELKLSEKVIKP